ncbi:MAG: diguanylate cyclase [Lachnospiraceae bacterium]|nr:diguanylate cyclase [Lachnospiraceae bacterium]
MSKIVKIKRSGKDSLYASFLMMTLIPLFIFGLIVTSFISYIMRQSMEEQTKVELKSAAEAVLSSFDQSYPGDYNLMVYKKDQTLYKGDVALTDETLVMDNIKAVSGVDVSIYFANICMVTTIIDSEGERSINRTSADIITNDVVLGKTEKFYDNVEINRVPYFAYYKPIFSMDGKTCLGMIGVAKSKRGLTAMINSAIIKNFLIMIGFMIITGFIIVKFTSQIMDGIKKILEFLGEVSGNNLNAKLDETVQKRNDELGEIGQAAEKLQLSLRKLIERDALTSLYNRRAAEKKLDQLEAEGIKSSISIGDIDFFKKFNDSFGHECGDAVLREVAATLNEGMRGKGFVARWGGEEFLLVFEGIEEIAAGLFLTEILQSIRDHKVIYDGEEHAVTMTFGVTGRADDEKVNDQIRRADDKLYEGKKTGRNRVIV